MPSHSALQGDRTERVSEDERAVTIRKGENVLGSSVVDLITRGATASLYISSWAVITRTGKLLPSLKLSTLNHLGPGSHDEAVNARGPARTIAVVVNYAHVFSLKRTITCTPGIGPDPRLTTIENYQRSTPHLTNQTPSTSKPS